MVTFALNFWVDGLRPLGYHLVNAALHAVAAWFLFLLMRRLLARAADDWWRAHATSISALGVLVWMLHPVQTQAVVYTWQRSTTLCVVCYLGTLLCYVEGRTRERGRWRWWLAGAVLAAAALVAKEIAGRCRPRFGSSSSSSCRRVGAAGPGCRWQRSPCSSRLPSTTWVRGSSR